MVLKAMPPPTPQSIWQRGVARANLGIPWATPAPCLAYNSFTFHFSVLGTLSVPRLLEVTLGLVWRTGLDSPMQSVVGRLGRPSSIPGRGEPWPLRPPCLPVPDHQFDRLYPVLERENRPFRENWKCFELWLKWRDSFILLQAQQNLLIFP